MLRVLVTLGSWTQAIDLGVTPGHVPLVSDFSGGTGVGRGDHPDLAASRGLLRGPSIPGSGGSLCLDSGGVGP